MDALSLLQYLDSLGTIAVLVYHSYDKNKSYESYTKNLEKLRDELSKQNKEDVEKVRVDFLNTLKSKDDQLHSKDQIILDQIKDTNKILQLLSDSVAKIIDTNESLYQTTGKEIADKLEDQNKEVLNLLREIHFNNQSNVKRQ